MSNEPGSVNRVWIGWGGRTVEGSLLETVADGDISESGVREERFRNDREGKWALDIQGRGDGWNFRLRLRHVPVRKRLGLDIWGS